MLATILASAYSQHPLQGASNSEVGEFKRLGGGLFRGADTP